MLGRFGRFTFADYLRLLLKIIKNVKAMPDIFNTLNRNL